MSMKELSEPVHIRFSQKLWKLVRKLSKHHKIPASTYMRMKAEELMMKELIDESEMIKPLTRYKK